MHSKAGFLVLLSGMFGLLVKFIGNNGELLSANPQNMLFVGMMIGGSILFIFAKWE